MHPGIYPKLLKRIWIITSQLLLCYCGSVFTIYRVDGQLGSSVDLPCPAFDPPSEDRAIAAFWYKDDEIIPFYTVDGRSTTSLKEGKHRQLSALGHRSKFNATAKPAVLQLEVESKGDEGVYVCRIDFYKSLTKTSTVALYVTAPAPKLTIYEGSNPVSGVGGPYKEKAELELTCELTGGDQEKLQLHWLIGNTVVDVTYKATSNRRLRNVLWIKSVEREHFMSVFTCLATKDNSSAGQLLKTSIQLDVFLRPVDVFISPKNPTTKEHITLTMFCTTRGSRPPAEITWWMGSTRLYNTTRELRNPNETISTLVLSPSMSENGKAVVCRAENLEIKYSIMDNVILNVTFSPRVSLSLKTYSDNYVSEGDTVALVCHVEANPATEDISWAFVKGPFYQLLDDDDRGGDDHGTWRTGSVTLVLEKLEAKHKGSYRCSASNSVGSRESNSLWLAVRHRPVCIPGQQVSYGARRGEILNIRCEVDADPPQVTFYWSFTNTIVQHNNLSFTSRGLRSIATYTPTQDIHLGSLFCWAKNSLGEQHVPCTFTVYLPAPPNPPKSCRISNASGGSLSVACHPGYDGGAAQQFHLWARVKGFQASDPGLNISSSFPVFSITGLPLDTTFDIVVAASNKMGWSDLVVLVHTTSRSQKGGDPAGPKFWKKGVNNWLFLLFIVFASAVIASVIAVLYRQRWIPCI